MTDDQLFELHRLASLARPVAFAVFAVFAYLALVNDWPKWAIWVTVVPPAVALFVAAWIVVPFCRWLEDRRGWDEVAL
jgi:hypothetical protein